MALTLCVLRFGILDNVTCMHVCMYVCMHGCMYTCVCGGGVPGQGLRRSECVLEFTLNMLVKAVPIRLAAGFLPHRSGFNPTADCMGFVVDKTTSVEIFLHRCSILPVPVAARSKA